MKIFYIWQQCCHRINRNIVCKDYEISAKKKQFDTIGEKPTDFIKISPLFAPMNINMFLKYLKKIK